MSTLALLTGAATALARWTPIFDPDAFWHLHTGQYIVAHRAIPWVDAFSHTARGRAWRFVDAAADVTLYGAWALGGARGLLALTVALGFVAAALSVYTQSRALDDDGPRLAPLLAVAPWTVAALTFRLTPRPQTFTFVMLSALLAVVVSSRARPRLLWLCPLLVAVWQNLHASGPLGVLVVGAVAVGATIDARIAGTPRTLAQTWAVTALSALALLLCPHPLDRLSEGLSHVADRRLAALITEWQPLYTGHGLSAPAVALLGLAALALVGIAQPRARRPETALVFIAAGITVMAVRAVRFAPLAGLALAPVAVVGARRITEALRRPAWGAMSCGAIALAGVAALRLEARPFGSGLSDGFFPVRAAEFVARTQPAGNLVHDFEMGGYLMFTLGARHPVFVDGRSWALYDADFLVDALQLTADRIERLTPRYDLRLAVLWTEARVGALQRAGWRLVYLDDVASVLVRAPDDDAYAARYGYRELHPASWFDDMARWSRDASARARAEVESERMVREAPGSALAWVLRAAVAWAAGRGDEADASAARALRLRPDLIPPHRMMMLRCAERGDRGCACAQSAAVRARAPRNAQAIETARRYGCGP